VDGGTAPPTPIAGTLKTVRDDFQIVFTPDPANPMPPSSTIVVTLLGGASGITDVVGNPFEGDPATPGTFQFQFETVTEPPRPNNPITIDVANLDGAVYVGTQQDFLVVAEAPFGAGLAVGQFDLSLWATGNPVPNSTRKIGKPGEMIVDPRFHPVTSHSWIYMIDKAARDVVVISSQTSQVVHRWKNLSDPSGLAQNGGMLYVTNRSNDSVSLINVAQLTVGTLAASDQMKGLSDPANRPADILVGRGPVGAAHGVGVPFLFIANSQDNTCSAILSATGVVSTTFSIGTSPIDVAATVNFPGIGFFAFITCLGGGSDDNGSVSLYWSRPNGLQANITGFKNPKGLIYDRGASAYIANSGGNTVSRLTLAFAGGGFAATILPTITATMTVGKNPSDVTMDPLLLALGAAPIVITADRGSSTITFVNGGQPIAPNFQLKIPGAQSIAAYWDQ